MRQVPIEDDRQMNEPPSNGTTPVVMITNLNEDEIDCDKIFTLCGVFGDVQRVKISYHKRDTAFVQLANHRQAKHVVTSLNRMQLYGKMIHVNLSRMTRVKLPKDSPNFAMMFPDAMFLTKDYTNCKNHRYSRKGAGGIQQNRMAPMQNQYGHQHQLFQPQNRQQQIAQYTVRTAHHQHQLQNSQQQIALSRMLTLQQQHALRVQQIDAVMLRTHLLRNL